MIMYFGNDPVKIPFNDWLMKNGIYLAIGVAALLLIIVTIIILVSKSKKS